MSKSWKKRGAAFLLAAVIAVGAAGCAPKSDTPANGGAQSGRNAADDKLFSEPTEVSMVIGSHVSWPYNENWMVWELIEEATNAKLNIQAIPGADFATKIPLMMASPDTLPDLLHTWQKREVVDAHALSGAFVAFDDHPELLTNFYAFWDSLPAEEKTDAFARRTSGDGKIYSAPSYGTQTVSGLYTWMYRKDIFEKHSLEVPTTSEELYQTAKKLKELYPESYPLCFRDGIGKLLLWGPSWQPYMSHLQYYDYTDNTWKFGPQQPAMKEMVEYFLKLKNEELIPPDYITMETKSWEELMTTDRGFISLDYIVRLDYYNLPMRQQNPDYTLALMAPPKPDYPGSSQVISKTNADYSGFSVCNTSKAERIENAFRFVDWMYTDKACELLSWGKEGVSYTQEGDEKSFILTGDETPQLKYGLGTYGTYQRMETAANEAMYSKEQIEACHQVLPYLEPYTNPSNYLPFTEDQSRELAAISDDLRDYVVENLSKFLLGQRPMSEWDTFVAGLDDMGVVRLLELYEESYQSITNQ